MSESGSAQPIDYYRALGLDTRSPSHALLAQLSHRIAQTPPGPERHLMEQARAILGDVGKKQVYDRRLTNTYAKPWTPDELHALALAHPSRPARSGLAAKLSAIPRRVLAAVAGGLALALVLVVTLVSCTGGSGSTGTDAVADDSRPGAPASADCRPVSVDDTTKAAWAKGAEPGYAIVLTDAYPLPSDMSAELARMTSSASTSSRTINTYPDGQISVTVPRALDGILGGMIKSGDGKTITHSALYSPEGRLLGQRTKTKWTTRIDPDIQKSGEVDLDEFDDSGVSALTLSHTYGTFRMAAADGITIPAEAASDKTDGDYALDILIDDENSDRLWLLLRGGTDLYKARVVEATPGTDPADCV
ncbi:hypothetical protein [Gordonia sp. MP11Mi]|uniref:Uncharacterized protein n=1 Tax=Gordonia sp. MP11Mi TaxID=3022769 RepID=A0AA97GX09_9ACTN